MHIARSMFIILSLCPTLCFAGQANAGGSTAVTAIVGGRLLTVSHGTIDHGTLLISAGKIVQVGSESTVKIPKDALIIHAEGMTVYPGLIDSQNNLGLIETDLVVAANDPAETSDEIFPNMHVYDAFHADTEHIPIARFNGITNAVVAPVDLDSMPGQDIFIQLAGQTSNDMILGRDVALPMNFSAQQRRSGGKFPETRMGLAQQLRQTWLDAKAYMEAQDASDRKAAADKNPRTPGKKDSKLEALIPYLKGERPVVIGAYESHDVQVAMEIAKEFHLKVVLNHVTHAQDMLDLIASYKVPVIFGPIYDFPLPGQRYDAVFSMPAELYRRGVKLAFASYGYSFRLGAPNAGHTRNLPYAAGYAVAYGLPYDEALKSITLNAAEIWGMGDKLGSLDVGKMANVVIANGDPLDVRTTVKQVFIQGQAMPMTTRQTELRDRYWPTSVPKPQP